MESEKVVWRGHPAWFRRRPAAIAASVVAIVGGCCVLPAIAWSPALWVGVAAIVGVLALRLVVWWLESRATTLTVTVDRTICRSGILARRTSEVRHCDVRNLQIDQSIGQRIMGTGSIGISSAGQGDVEIRVEGIVEPDRVASIIRGRRASAGG